VGVSPAAVEPDLDLERAGEREAAEWAAAFDAAFESLAQPAGQPGRPSPRPSPPRTPAPAAPIAGLAEAPDARLARSATKLRSSSPDQLHARLFWGDALLVARAFEFQRPVFALLADLDLLAQHGFQSRSARPLVSTAGDAWTVSPPEHVEAFVRTGDGWVPASASAGKELRLGPGDRLRLASGLFALELSTQPPPSKARGTFVRNLDVRLIAILAAILAGLVATIGSLPPPQPARPQEKEAVRYVQAKVEQAKKEPPRPKKEKPKPRPEEAQAQPADAPRPSAPLQEARTYKAAATQLKSLDKI
jgi:hypothetical protein